MKNMLSVKKGFASEVLSKSLHKTPKQVIFVTIENTNLIRSFVVLKNFSELSFFFETSERGF